MHSHFWMCVCVCVCFQAIFDRNRKDELPGLQLGWIDGICSPLYEVTLQAPPPPPVAFTVTQPSSPSVLAVLPQPLSPPPLTPAVKLSLTTIQTFLGSSGFLTGKKKRKKIIFFSFQSYEMTSRLHPVLVSVSVHFLTACEQRAAMLVGLNPITDTVWLWALLHSG